MKGSNDLYDLKWYKISPKFRKYLKLSQLVTLDLQILEKLLEMMSLILMHMHMMVTITLISAWTCPQLLREATVITLDFWFKQIPLNDWSRIDRSLTIILSSCHWIDWDFYGFSQYLEDNLVLELLCDEALENSVLYPPKGKPYSCNYQKVSLTFNDDKFLMSWEIDN